MSKKAVKKAAKKKTSAKKVSNKKSNSNVLSKKTSKVSNKKLFDYQIQELGDRTHHFDTSYVDEKGIEDELMNNRVLQVRKFLEVELTATPWYNLYKKVVIFIKLKLMKFLPPKNIYSPKIKFGTVNPLNIQNLDQLTLSDATHLQKYLFKASKNE